MLNKQKVIILLGPTASGKTDLSISIAQQFNNYIISADSRQIYRGMDIATGKINGVTETRNNILAYWAQDIPHFLINVVDPDQSFTLADWQKQTYDLINKPPRSLAQHTPLIVGGTGLYISSISEGYSLPQGEINTDLRHELSQWKLEDLKQELKKVDPATFNEIDHENKRRVVRALEYTLTNKQSYSRAQETREIVYDILQIGLYIPREELYQRIEKRVDMMFAEGIIDEAKQLLNQYSVDLPSMSGIGYQEIAHYLNNTLSLDEVKQKIKQHTKNYAKRQLTWFKRDKSIIWVSSPDKAIARIAEFLA